MSRSTLIGSEIIIKDLKHSIIVGAMWIDDGRRVRLLTGEHKGEALQRHQFEVLERVTKGNTMEALLGLLWDND